MVLTLLGDTVGVPHEWKRAEEILADLESRGGLYTKGYFDPWKKRRGIEDWIDHPQQSDDSELGAGLGLVLLETPTLNARILYYVLRGFIHGRRSILVPGAKAFGTGKTLRAALKAETYEGSLERFKSEIEIPLVPSNGSLMRNIGIPLKFHQFPVMLIDYSMKQSRVTHRHPLCVAACIAHSFWVDSILQGQHPHDAWKSTQQRLGVRSKLPVSEFEGLPTILALEPTRPTEDEIWPNCGSVVTSLRIALWATCTAENVYDGLYKSISIGGDTDTYAAIAGGALGAHFGAEDVPIGWLTELQGYGMMRNLGNDLYDRCPANNSV